MNSGDLISRDAVIKAIYDNNDRLNIAQAIRELPPVNPQEPIYYPPCEDCHNKMNEIRKAYDKIQSAEPKTGHWKSFTHSAYHGVDDDNEPIWREVKVYHCSECNRRTVIKENYCPNCGARMESEE